MKLRIGSGILPPGGDPAGIDKSRSRETIYDDLPVPLGLARAKCQSKWHAKDAPASILQRACQNRLALRWRIGRRQRGQKRHNLLVYFLRLLVRQPVRRRLVIDHSRIVTQPQAPLRPLPPDEIVLKTPEHERRRHDPSISRLWRPIAKHR